MTTDEMIDAALANQLQVIMNNVTNRVLQNGRDAEDQVTNGMSAAGKVYEFMKRHKALLRREDEDGRATGNSDVL